MYGVLLYLWGLWIKIPGKECQECFVFCVCFGWCPLMDNHHLAAWAYLSSLTDEFHSINCFLTWLTLSTHTDFRHVREKKKWYGVAVILQKELRKIWLFKRVKKLKKKVQVQTALSDEKWPALCKWVYQDPTKPFHHVTILQLLPWTTYRADRSIDIVFCVATGHGRHRALQTLWQGCEMKLSWIFKNIKLQQKQ